MATEIFSEPIKQKEIIRDLTCVVNKSLQEVELTLELQSAKDRLQRAIDNFNAADPEYLDAAIFELNAARIQLDNVYRSLKVYDK